MTYQSLYRKYRPQHLSEVVGQKHILEVLENSLKKDMISHAYLFCGPRGTGKTSIAKLFAQSINCETQGAIACGTCSNCIEGQAGTHPDIVEIDAASNNGVDEIRSLIDRIKYTPILGKYKIYIIDEVHMLSAGAFNAFLKTLEEPPEHAVFVLATTEIHKVIPTIVSRCQRFDFNNLSDPAIKGRLDYILDLEQVDAEADVTQLIASLSNGALRNALTILEQAMIVANPTITLNQVHDLNGVVTPRQKYSLIQAIMGNDMNRLNNEIEVLLDNAVDVERLTMDLVKTLKDTVIFQYTKSAEHAPYSERSLVEFLAPRVGSKVLLTMVETLLDYSERMKFSHSQAAYFEIALIKLFNLSNEPALAVVQNYQVEKQSEIKLKTDFSNPTKPTVEKSAESISVPISKTETSQPSTDIVESPVRVVEPEPVINDINHIEREYNETEVSPQMPVIKDTQQEKAIEQPKLTVPVDETLDTPVHNIELPKVESPITHIEREYKEDIVEPVKTLVSVKEILEESPIESLIPEDKIFVSQEEIDEQYDSSLDAYEVEDKPVDIIQKDVSEEVIKSVALNEHETPVIQTTTTTNNLEIDPVSPELENNQSEELNEPEMLLEPSHKLGIEEIVKYMVSANKDIRMIDDVNFQEVNKYINNFEWAKCARLIGTGTLALSGDHFVMITLDDELEVKEVMEPSNNIELLKFSTMLFNNDKRIFATTKEEFSKAVVLFRSMHASGTLPSPLSKADIEIASTQQVEKERDIKLDKVKELFGNSVNIIS